MYHAESNRVVSWKSRLWRAKGGNDTPTPRCFSWKSAELIESTWVDVSMSAKECGRVWKERAYVVLGVRFVPLMWNRGVGGLAPRRIVFRTNLLRDKHKSQDSTEYREWQYVFTIKPFEWVCFERAGRSNVDIRGERKTHFWLRQKWAPGTAGDRTTTKEWCWATLRAGTAPAAAGRPRGWWIRQLSIAWSATLVWSRLATPMTLC